MQNINKIFVAIVLCLMAVTAQATPYKNIYVTLEVSPSGAGTVYISDPSTDHPSQTEPGDSVEMKGTFGEDHNDGDDVDWTGRYYYCELHATANEGFEFVGFAYKNDTGVYTDADIIGTDNPLKVNINIDSKTEGENNYDEVKARNDWNSTPDHQFVAVFVEVTSTGITSAVNGRRGEEPVYNLSGRRASPAYRGIAVRGGRKYIVK